MSSGKAARFDTKDLVLFVSAAVSATAALARLDSAGAGATSARLLVT
jgi:hypothetical protein